MASDVDTRIAGVASAHEQRANLRPQRFSALALLGLFFDNIFNYLFLHAIALVVLVVALAWALGAHHTARWVVPTIAVALYALILLGWNYLVWRRLKFAYNDHEALVDEGVIFRRVRRVELTHLQGLMVRTGPVFRLLKRCEVTGETAGGLRRPEIKMPAYQRVDATEFKNVVYRAMLNNDALMEEEERADADAHAAVSERADDASAWKKGFELPLSYIFVSALTSNSVIWAALTIIVPLSTAIITSLRSIDFNLTHIIDQGIFVWVISLIGALIALVIALVSISAKFLFDLGRKVLAAYGFRVERTGEVLHTKRGLIVTRESFMDAGRVQALSMRRPFMQRLFFFGAVNLDTAGFSNENRDGGSITSLAPIVRKRQMHTLISTMLPEYVSEARGKRSDLRGLGRFTFGPSMTALTALALAFFGQPLWHTFARFLNETFGVGASYALSWWTPWLATFVALGAFVFLITEIDVWFATNAAIDGDMLVLRTGRLGRREMRIYRTNIQGMRIRQTAFQRNDHHGHLLCSYISGSRGRCLTLRNLDEDVCNEIYRWYYSTTVG